MVVESMIGVAVDAVATQAIEKTASSLTEKLSPKFAKDKYDELKIKFNRGLPAYLAANYAKCQTIKTLLNRNSPIPLDDCFVAPKFSALDKKFTSDEILDEINQSSRKVIVTGLAGSGKSVFLKYAFRRLISKGHTYYPFFFELRLLNRRSAKPGMLLEAIFESINECCPEFTRAQLTYGLKSGAFYFLLDGFDEISQELRGQVAEEILLISRKHHECAVLVSSRPADEFVAWEGFLEAKLLPFSLEQSTEYIGKLEFDEEKKADFIADLNGELFEKNSDFLSNPLLAAMMLLTYDSYGEIPEKRHIFYSKCFDVLAREHDSSKGRYKRELFSDLSMDQIEKAFMFFCALSYVERAISFTNDQMRKFVTDAIASCGIEADTERVIRDFRESISIMELDGLVYEFAHRSFQEYFYAKFVVADRKLPLDEKIDWLVEGFGSDDTVEMIADMDRIYFEDEYLLPKASKLDAKLSKIDPDKNPSAILSKFFTNMHTSDVIGQKKNDKLKSIFYSHGNRLNLLIHQTAFNMFKNEIWRSNERRSEVELNEAAKLLDEKFHGEVKIHHSNNKKLLELDANYFARRMQRSIRMLKQHLAQLQEKRKRGLGAMIRKNYSEK